MENLFLNCLDNSVIICFVIIGIIMIRQILKKSPKIFSYGLWFIVLIRIIAPINIQSPFGVIPKSEGGIVSKINETNVVGKVIDTSIQYKENTINSLKIASIVWMVIAISIIVYGAYSFIKINRKLKDAEFLGEGIYKSKKIKSAFVLGIIKPKIYLPYGLSEKQEEYVLQHERIHIKRLDHITKLVWYILVAINFFNPLMWLAFTLMSKDMEMSCDEKVIEIMGREIKKEYSTSILILASKGSAISISPIGFGNGEVKERIKNILNYKKPRFWVSLVSIAAIASVGAIFLTNPIAKEKELKADVTVELSSDVKESLKNDEDNLMEEHKNPTIIEDYKYTGKDKIERLVYDTELARIEKLYKGQFDIFAIKVFNSYEEEDKLKVFAMVYANQYILADKIAYNVGGSSIPVAITYTKSGNDKYVVEKYEQARDGDEFEPSIEEYCTMPVSGKKLKGLFREIMNYQTNWEDLNKLERQYLIEHLIKNGQKDVKLEEINDKLENEYNKIT